MTVMKEPNPQRALVRAINKVHSDGEWVGTKKELLNVRTEIRKGEVGNWHEDLHQDIVEMLDNHHGSDHYEITTNWTFPTDEVKTNLTGEPTPTDKTGEYYDKLCSCEKGNQLQSMVDKIDQWGRNNRTVAQVFNVDRDLNAMFPPCLLHLQAFYRDDGLHLAASFRSHTLAKSFYGDLTALVRLQEWLSERADTTPGTLVVQSGSMHYRKKDNEHKLAKEMVETL